MQWSAVPALALGPVSLSACIFADETHCPTCAAAMSALAKIFRQSYGALDAADVSRAFGGSRRRRKHRGARDPRLP